MIQSMTGFGKASRLFSGKKITIEIKSLNSKGIDLFVKMPSVYRELELDWRGRLAQQLERGKVDFAIYVENTLEQPSTQLNVPVIKAYMQQLRDIHPEADATELMKMAVRMPEALKTEREELDPAERVCLSELLEEALTHLKQFRLNEGNVLKEELLLRIDNIRQLSTEIVVFEQQRIEHVRNKLQNALQDLKSEIDQNRFEQELIFYLEKLDVTEEKVRLNNHLNYFIETLNGQEANGRKLGFITQEMGREINTLGSKSNQSDMQKCVVQMKDELEKIKEQVLNIL
ncbi:MAG: YicC family protein [Flavobacterium sp. BFFFF2]|nr:MAG: YicC family protein [Flavobacterium sp. BFFFF2]